MTDPTTDPPATPVPDSVPDAVPGPAPKPHYRAPGWWTRNVFNRFVAFMTRHGVSLLGSRVLEVRGRTSGEPRRTPVNLLVHDGRHYLVSARGTGQWVRNVRAGDGRLATLVGKRREEWQARELAGDESVPVLRAYLAGGRPRSGCSSTVTPPTRPTPSCWRSPPATRRSS